MSEFSDNSLDITRENEEIFEPDAKEIGHKYTPIPKGKPDINIDTENEFYETIADLGDNGYVDINSLNNFTSISRNREQLYDALDIMAQDSTVSAILETYAEDATEENENGEIVWCESSDPYISQYVTFLLKTLGIDKNIYRWIYSLIKYGDIYLKLYRQSDFEDTLLTEKDKTTLNEKFSAIDDVPYNVTNDRKKVDESVILKAYKDNDKLVNYIDIVPNPAEMFELVKFGKTYAYIKTNSIPSSVTSQASQGNIPMYYLYKLRKQDVTVYNAVSFVHGSLQDDVPRLPEQVQIFNTNEDEDGYVYSVKSGQSILYNAYKIWREKMLLDNALLLNRITKSSMIRVLEVEVGDMPKGKVREKLQRVKSMVEQKSAIDTGNIMQEYVNPGAMENTIYVPTRNGIGSINTQQIGGDVNIRDIADIDHFTNQFYAAMKVPKMFFGETDDAAGFNGGTSLSILSSRYAKTVKRIQSAMTQTITDAINILLIDRGLDAYVNKFELHMQAPVTQEELDKRDAQSSKIQITNDVMSMLDDIDDPIIKLKALKSLLSQAISNQEVIRLVQDKIEQLEKEQDDELSASDDSFDDEDFDFGSDDFGSNDFGGGGDFGGDDFGSDFSDIESSDSGDTDFGDEVGGDNLPSPSDLGAGDFTNM